MDEPAKVLKNILKSSNLLETTIIYISIRDNKSGGANGKALVLHHLTWKPGQDKKLNLKANVIPNIFNLLATDNRPRKFIAEELGVKWLDITPNT